MLQVVDGGVLITLNGQKTPNTALYLSFGLIIFAIFVAIVAITMPAQVAIGAMAVLAVLVFLFNRYKQKQQNCITVSSGKLLVKPHCLECQAGIFNIDPQALIKESADKIVIDNINTKTKTLVITGIDDKNHQKIVCSVLKGQKIGKNTVNIKMKSG